jgi:CDP-4-dehydro-6-deoxyglucose reductase, E1
MQPSNGIGISSGAERTADELRGEILALTSEYYRKAFPSRDFIPGATEVSVSGRVFDDADLRLLVDASLDFWLTAGRYAGRFESGFARWCGAGFAVLANSGSSANLLALSALTSPKLGARRLKPGDEVITIAAGFPTTLNPILQNGLTPVFVDVTIPEYNVDASLLEGARSERTRAIILPHTLGNPFPVDAVVEFARKHGLWLIEDCCDALGAAWQGRKTGTFGDLATFSFYPAHHITMGEGGCVVTSDPMLARIVTSFRDWGRDCWCAPGADGTCRARYDRRMGSLPAGYDHKYTYSHIGYNLKATDMQAAVGVAQLAKLPGWIEVRRRNFALLSSLLRDVGQHFVLPRATPGSEPSWFGFPLAVRPEAPFSREELLRHLEARRVATRLLFGGNLLHQPAYQGISARVPGSLERTNFVMERVFWIGLYPGLTESMLEYAAESIRDFLREKEAR